MDTFSIVNQAEPNTTLSLHEPLKRVRISLRDVDTLIELYYARKRLCPHLFPYFDYYIGYNAGIPLKKKPMDEEVIAVEETPAEEEVVA